MSGAVYHADLPSNRMHEFNRSIQYTKKLYKVDIRQSIAYSKALHQAGILSDGEAAEMERGLKVMEQEWDDGSVSSASYHYSGIHWRC